MGTEELGLELYWDMERHIAGFRLNVMEKESPVQLWETSIPILLSDTAINFPNLLKNLEDLYYLLYKTALDKMKVIPDLAHVLFYLRLFVQKLED